ncbi:MAG TPA: fused MFS/spermidine synthase [Planctomycetota bacterium]|jgi:spermidine synthase
MSSELDEAHTPAETPAPPLRTETTDGPGFFARMLLLHLPVWVLFLFSGACGLIYEVLWCRQLGLIFGNTAHSLSAVLTAFMAGLALGSYAAGRLCHRLKRPLLAYGALELLIGIYCALLPALIGDHSAFIPLYKSLYGETGSASLGVVRFAISFFLLLIPTTFMGATLPVLSQLMVSSRERLGRTVGALYAVNSFGAVAGALAAGFVLLPELGKATTNWVAVGCNVALGLIAVGLSVFGPRARKPNPPAPFPKREGGDGVAALPQTPPPAPPLDGEGRTAGGTPAVQESVPVSAAAVKAAVITFGVTGFAAMATQIGWTRAISLGTGSSTYAFSLIVAIFILGLSLGGAWGSRLAAKVRDPVSTLAMVLLLIGLFNILVAIALGYGPVLFFYLIAWGSQIGWNTLLALEALGIALLIIWPTFLMGATIPLTLQVASRSSVNAGRTVGSVYSVNTIGAILGSFFGGLIILPALQIQCTLEVMAWLYAAPGVLLFLLARPQQRKAQVCMAFLALALFVVTGLSLLWEPMRWDPLRMSAGNYLLRDPQHVQAARALTWSDILQGKVMDVRLGDENRLLYYNEGAECTVSVTMSEMQGEKVTSLRVGGKPDASAPGDMATQVSLTLVPEILHRRGPEDVLVIGLGSGVSAGTALAMPSVKRVDVVEMSPQVVEASWYFREHNKLTYSVPSSGAPDAARLNGAPFHTWIDTPKVNVVINDGRNHLLLSSRKYDIIASEPSNPWISGIGNLFTVEAFKLCRQRLRDDGIMCQWIHGYGLEQWHVCSVIRSFGQVFEHVQLWECGAQDYLLIGSAAPLDTNVKNLCARMKLGGTPKWLDEIHIDGAPELLSGLLADSKLLERFTRRAPLHTDDNMLLEFNAPRAMYRRENPFCSTSLLAYPQCIADLSQLSEQDGADFLRELDIRFGAREHFRLALEHFPPSGREPCYTVAARLAPTQFWAAIIELKLYLLQRSRYQEQQQRASKAVQEEQLDPESATLKEAQRLLKEKKAGEALAEAKKISSQGNVGPALLVQAQATALKKDYDSALSLVREASTKGVAPLECCRISAQILYDAGRKDDALATVDSLLQAVKARSDPQAAPLWALGAELYRQRGQLRDAHIYIQRALVLAQQHSEYNLLRAKILSQLGRSLEAIRVLRERAVRDPLNAEAQIDLIREVLSHVQRVQDEDRLVVAQLLNLARWMSRALCVMQPESAAAWETLCRSLLAVEKSDMPTAKFCRPQLEKAYAKLLSLHDGDATKIPQDLVREIQLGRAVQH